TQTGPNYKKIDLPTSQLFYRSPRTQIIFQRGGPNSAAFGMVVASPPPSKDQPVFEFGPYEVTGAEISFAGSANKYKGWVLSAPGAKTLPQYIFVSNEMNKVPPAGGYPIGYWAVNPQTKQGGWQFRYDAVRLPYRGPALGGNEK